MIGSTNRTQAWLNFAQRSREEGGLGLAPHQAAGLVGNLHHESGKDLNPWGPSGDNGSAWGTAQWRLDRLDRLKRRPDYQTMEGQQAFMREELDTSENKAYRALQAAQTPEEAAAAFNTLYERSADRTGNRERAARQLMAQFGGDTSSPPGALSYAAEEQPERKNMGALDTENLMGPGALNGGYGPDKMGVIGSALTGMGASLAGITNSDQARALVAQQAAMQKAPADRGTWSFQVLPDGRVMRYNSKLGIPEIVGSAKKPEPNVYNEQYDSKGAEDSIKLNTQLNDAAMAATASSNDFAQLDKALKNPDVGQGLSGPVRNFLNKAYVSMNIGDAKTAQAASDADIINSLGPKMALNIVQNGGHKLLPGSMSDGDLALVRKFGAGETLEPAANRKLLEAAIRVNQRTLEAEQVRQAAIAANGGRLPQNFRSELGKLAQKWSAEDKERESAASAPAQTTATPQQTNSFTTKSGKTLNWSVQK